MFDFPLQCEPKCVGILTLGQGAGERSGLAYQELLWEAWSTLMTWPH